MAIVESQCAVSEGQAGRLDLIVQTLTGRSRAEVRGLLEQGCVELNGQTSEQPGVRVQPGDTVVVRHDPHVRYRERPRARESSAFRVVFEDPQLIVVDKEAGVLTVPTDALETNTLLDAVNRHLSRRRQGFATVVHRLDRWTSGLLVFGKNRRMAGQLQDQFRVRKAEREYAAIVAGHVTQPDGTFTSQLSTSKSLQRYSVEPDEEGEAAVTHYRVERRLRNATYVRVRLETGRRNQIRVHFSDAGHPVLGDDRYGTNLASHAGWRCKRLALHAAILGFVHPQTGRPMSFESPLPAEFQHFLAKQG